MQPDLSPIVAATAEWLTRAYPSCGGALASALSEVQARQAVTVAAWLRYPTSMDAALVGIAGPGGSGRLDRITGLLDACGEEDADTDADPDAEADAGTWLWRTWVDEVVASWAVCLLTDPELAGRAVAAITETPDETGRRVDFRRLLAPDEDDRRAAALLRHPDLVAPVAELHRARLLDRLGPGRAPVA